jgi:hypothetical protein
MIAKSLTTFRGYAAACGTGDGFWKLENVERAWQRVENDTWSSGYQDLDGSHALKVNIMFCLI